MTEMKTIRKQDLPIEVPEPEKKQCPYCDGWYVSLDPHVEACPKAHKCPDCGKKCSSERGLAVHIGKMHSELKKNPKDKQIQIRSSKKQKDVIKSNAKEQENSISKPGTDDIEKRVRMLELTCNGMAEEKTDIEIMNAEIERIDVLESKINKIFNFINAFKELINQ